MSGAKHQPKSPEMSTVSGEAGETYHIADSAVANDNEKEKNTTTSPGEKVNKTQEEKIQAARHGFKQLDKDGHKAIPVDLSQVKSASQFRNKPTLASLLTEYGMEDKHVAAKKKDKAKDNQHRKKRKRGFGDDSDRDTEKEQQTEERHLQILEDMKTLRDFYYDEYSQLLQNKIDKQRQDIHKHSLAMEKKAKQKEKESLKAKKRIEHHHLTSDNSFLQNIPKTDLYHIVQLQDKLIKEGSLKNLSDLEQFWKRIQQPDIFYTYFKVPKSDDLSRNGEDYNENATLRTPWHAKRLGSVSVQDPASQPSLGGKDSVGAKVLHRIAEARQSLKSQTREHPLSIIQQQHVAHDKESCERSRSSTVNMAKPQSSCIQARAIYQQELEKRFPKLEMPKLHCFTMSLGPKPPDPEEVRHEIHLHHLERNRKSYTHRLTKMHQLAMANAAASSRILEMHEDIDFILNGSPLQDLISDHHYYSGLPEKKAEAKGSAHAITEALLSSPLQPSLLPPEGSTVCSATGQRVTKQRSGKRSSQRSKQVKMVDDIDDIDDIDERHLFPQTPAESLPLSMLEIKAKTRTLSAKCLSTMWTNYTSQAGVYLNEPYKV